MNAQTSRDRPVLRLVPPLVEPEKPSWRLVARPATTSASMVTWAAIEPVGLLTVTHRDRGATWLMTLAGEADISTREELAGGLRHALAKVPVALVVDVARLEFCDSRCATAVIEANYNAPDTDMVLTGSHGMVRRVFDLLDPRQTLARPW